MSCPQCEEATCFADDVGDDKITCHRCFANWEKKSNQWIEKAEDVIRIKKIEKKEDSIETCCDQTRRIADINGVTDVVCVPCNSHWIKRNNQWEGGCCENCEENILKDLRSQRFIDKHEGHTAVCQGCWTKYKIKKGRVIKFFLH